jgi:hypothetical protein
MKIKQDHTLDNSVKRDDKEYHYLQEKRLGDISLHFVRRVYFLVETKVLWPGCKLDYQYYLVLIPMPVGKGILFPSKEYKI